VTESEDQRRRDWLAKVAAHPETTEADYAAAEASLSDDPPSTEQITNLVRLGFLSKEQEWVATLRCQTWNIWPESNVAEQRICIALEQATELRARLAVLSYVQRSAPECYVKEQTNVGPLLWDGETPGLHHVRDTILKAPEDAIELRLDHRYAYRGEVDICINFKFNGDLPAQLIEDLRAIAYSTMSLINLKLGDYLTPAAPFQLRKVFQGGQGQFTSMVALAVVSRSTIKQRTLEETISEIADIHRGSEYGEKLTIALELYAAHFTEQQVRVRFILLVIAMEALSKKSYKHQVARDLLDRWKEELKAEKDKYDRSSEEFKSLDDLHREIKWRAESSLGDGVRKLFAALPDVSNDERESLQRRAMAVYRQRSTLVHEGYMPIDDLPGLEKEARELVEILFRSVIERTIPKDEGWNERDDS